MNSLDASQIAQLTEQGCSSKDWKSVSIASGTDFSRLRNVHFLGAVSIGDLKGSITSEGVELPCGIYNATISDCTVGSRVRIAGIGTVIAQYDIADDVLIEDVASLTSERGAAFGCGIELDVINEGGGRGTKIIPDITAQTAYLQAAHRHDGELTKRLAALVDAKAESRPPRGSVGKGARILHCGSIHNAVVGPAAKIHGALQLDNGTLGSCEEHPTEIGEGVLARSFILAEGAKVDSGALLDKVFVGQGVKIGKQYSAENSLFFANCEAFHGEGVSLFAGPYTVTHHKSTLLIAGLFSFYNAGSGTNQSNHMYKLGPVHQGIFERGCKTGSFSYVLLEGRIGAFSVVIGKHYTNINTPNLPFSYIHEDGGVSKIIPGMNLFSVGTVRDGEKWPKRDNRKGPVKRDLLIFDVFSPYTVEKMRRGRDELTALSESTPKEKNSITYGGLQISRLLLRKGAKYYALAISRYLTDRVVARVTESMKGARRWNDVVSALAPTAGLAHAAEWTDLAGLLAAGERVAELEAGIRSGSISTYESLLGRLQSIYGSYRADEWQYVCETYAKEYGKGLDSMTREQAAAAIEEWKKSALSLHGMILEDSKREFAAFARIGYGLDLSEGDAARDFEAVRGSAETNSVVRKLVEEEKAIQTRYAEFTRQLASLAS